MKHFQHIAACIDFSDSSGVALKQALHLARPKHGKVSALYFATPEEVGDFEGSNRIESNVAKENLEDGLMRFVTHYGGAQDLAECKVLVGEPSDTIAQYIKGNPTDLIVLGSRGDDSEARHTGHFATKCVRHSPIPILLSRRRAKKHFKKIVACVDFSTASQEVIKTAMQITKNEQAELHIIHAVTPPWLKPSHVMYTLEPLEDKDFQIDYLALLQGKLETFANDAMGENETSSKPSIRILEHVSPDLAIIDYLNSQEADLAIVGRLGHLKQLVSQCFIGTTAERLIRNSPCAVLTVPCNPEE